MGNAQDKDSTWADPSLLVGLPMAVRAAIILNVPEIIDAAYPTLALSAQEICKHVPTSGEHSANPNPDNLEKLLDWLCCNGVFAVTVEEGVKKYSHSPKSRCLSQDTTTDVVLMYTSPQVISVWSHAHEIVLHPEVSTFEHVTGKLMYKYLAEDAPDVQRVYVNVLNRTAAKQMKLLEKYDEEFKALKGRVVDVGGQVGTTCAELVEKYPHLQFVNFDLPEVVKAAPEIPGVEHVGGSFLDTVPQGNLLIMKFCLLNWSDENCIKILTHCRKALSAAQGGKLLIVDPLDRSTEVADSQNERPRFEYVSSAWFGFQTPVLMSAAKKRTVEQIRSLALAAGFSKLEFVESAAGQDLMEAILLPCENTH